MATNPYFTQYHTQRFSLIGSPQQRDGDHIKDQRFLNLFPELIKSPISDGKKYYLKKRPGLHAFQSLPTGTSQGFFYWRGNYYYAIGGVLYKNTTPLLNLTQSTGVVGFVEYRVDPADELFVCDGHRAWLVNSDDTYITISSPNFPNPHIPMPIFFDGYIVLAGGNQRVYNSALGDPNTWPADGFLDAEMYPDTLVGLAKVQNYVAAIGQASIEWFYDNANATGSPFTRNAPAVSQFGCPAPSTIVQTEKELILVGSTGTGGRTVWVIDGFQPTEIGNEPVREALDLEGADILFASGNTIQCLGHKWYILNLTSKQRTFVYDFEEKMWHEWTSGTDQAVFEGRFAADSGIGMPVWLGYLGGTSYYMSQSDYTDHGNTINCVAITVKIDFDTTKRKRFYRLSLVGDAPNGNNQTPVTVKWSDDDYNTWSSGATLYLNGTYPTITQMGYGRRRAFQFVFQQPWPLRLESFELDIIQEVRR